METHSVPCRCDPRDVEEWWWTLCGCLSFAASLHCGASPSPLFRHPGSKASGDMGRRLNAGRGVFGASDPGESPLQLGLRSDFAEMMSRCHQMS